MKTTAANGVHRTKAPLMAPSVEQKKIIARQYDEAIAAAAADGDTAKVEDLLRRQADDLALLKRFTQHWFRHHLATRLGRSDIKAAMKQGGWKDMRSVIGYLIPDAEYQRHLVEQRGSAGTRTDTRGHNG